MHPMPRPTVHEPTPGHAPPAVIESRQQAMWASANFAAIGTTLQIVGEGLAETLDLRAGERVIDVAAGNGNATLAAARRFAAVTSTDFVGAVLDRGAARARAEGVDVTFRVAAAEALPFGDGSFDVATSVFGVMFAPDQRRVASELLRVVRSGGRIGLASWTPDGFVGQLLRVVGAHVPPPEGSAAPTLWGTEPHMVQLFGWRADDMRSAHRIFNFRYASAAHWIQVFRDCYGPLHAAFAALPPVGQAALESDLHALLGRWNAGGDRSLVVPAEYLEVVVVKE